jgi:NAD-dependent DNA ligase
VSHIPTFLAFLAECGLTQKLVSSETTEEVSKLPSVEHPLYKKSVVFTGVRDPAAISALKNVGGILGSSVSKNTVVVIAKSVNEDTGKAADAKKLGIPIMTPSEFMTKYF